MKDTIPWGFCMFIDSALKAAPALPESDSLLHGSLHVSHLTGNMYRQSSTKTVLARRRDYKEARNRHKIVTSQLLAGLTNDQIAQATGYSPQTVSHIANSTIVKTRLNELHTRREDEIVEKQIEIAELVPAAVKLYKEIMADRNEDTKHRLHAADAVCEHGIPKSVNVVQTTVTQDIITEVKERAMAAAKEMGILALDSAGERSEPLSVQDEPFDVQEGEPLPIVDDQSVPQDEENRDET